MAGCVSGDAEAQELVRRLRKAGEGLARRSAEEMAHLLGKVSDLFLAAIDDKAVHEIATRAALSPEMLRAVLAGMAESWTADGLLRLLRAEFPDPTVLDRFIASDGRFVRARGNGVTAIWGAASVPGVTITAIIRALLVKSPVVVKPGAGDLLLTTRFVQALSATDSDVANSVALRYWPGGAPEYDEWERALLRSVNQVVVYGEDATIESIRSRASASTRLIEHPNRVGVALVDPACAPDSAAQAAQAVALFEQRGCVSPHLFLVIDRKRDYSMVGGKDVLVGGKDMQKTGQSTSGEGWTTHRTQQSATEAAATVGTQVRYEKTTDASMALTREWCEALADELAELERTLPLATHIGAAEMSQVHQLRGRILLRQAAMPECSAEPQMWASQGPGWTVILANLGDFVPVGGRTAWVVSVAGTEELLEALSALPSSILQTVGLAGVTDLSEQLLALGVTRVVPLDKMPFPDPCWLHDGSRPLGELVRWGEVEGGQANSPLRG